MKSQPQPMKTRGSNQFSRPRKRQTLCERVCLCVRRRRVVRWLTTKWTTLIWADSRDRQSSPNRCQQSPSSLSSSRGECLQVVPTDSPDLAFHGNRLLMEGSGRGPDHRGQGPGATSQRPYVQLSPECDTVASANLPLINKGWARHDSTAKCSEAVEQTAGATFNGPVCSRTYGREPLGGTTLLEML